MAEINDAQLAAAVLELLPALGPEVVTIHIVTEQLAARFGVSYAAMRPHRAAIKRLVMRASSGGDSSERESENESETLAAKRARTTNRNADAARSTEDTRSPAAALVAAQLAAAWRRWQQRPPARASTSSSSSSDDEAQFELVALGLAAALSDSQLRALFDGAGDGPLALLLPLQPAFQHDPRRFHFALVALARLAERALERESAASPPHKWRRLVHELLLPLLQRQQFARVHAVALSVLRLVVRVHGEVMSEPLAATVVALLTDQPSVELEDEEENEDADDAQRVDFSALCGVLRLLLESGETQPAASSATTSSDGVLACAKQICAHAIARFDTAPQFLRAVAAQLIPVVLRAAPTAACELAAAAVGAWRRKQLQRSKSVANVLFLLCLLVPSDPTLLADAGLQELTAFALADADALLRKQALFLLNAAFAHYARGAELSGELATWQRFLVASDVIQMHEQQHLIEQVWPQVMLLLESSLVVVRSSSSSDNSAAASSAAPSPSSWPVPMSFDWVQSLLRRVFSHENPLVRRTFMLAFMETCLAQWRAPRGGAAVDADASFVCSASFHAFVFAHLLPALNDPQMYKTSTKAAFQHATRAFLAAYLAFQLANRDVPPAAASVAKRYVDAVYAAVFGPGVSGHSPDALVTMLEVFASPELQVAVQQRDDAADLLDDDALDTLRVTMEFRVLRSFPQSVRVKITRALVSALTGGFADVAALSLHSVARLLLVLPLRIVVGDDGSAYLALHRWLHAASSSSNSSRSSTVFTTSLSTELARYLSASQEPGASVLSASHLSRLLLFVSDVKRSEQSTEVAIHAPLARLAAGGDVDSRQLLRLLGAFEAEVAQVGELGLETRLRFAFAFTPQTFYSADADARFGYQALFRAGREAATQWTRSLASSSDEQTKEENIEALAATALVVTRTAIYAMEQDGDLAPMRALDGVCESLKRVLADSPETAARADASEQTLALRFLAVVASQPTAVDSLPALQGDAVLPLLLSARLNTGAESSKLRALCTVQFFESRWTLMHRVLLGASYLPTELLTRVFAECLESLAAAGADPRVLCEMVQVLALALAQLAATFVAADDREERLDALYHAVWGEYSECLAKPDALTRAVVHCLFQPAFLLSEELCRGTLKRWLHRFLSFGAVHRPNVIFHLACRLVQVWRVRPHTALWFVDEIVTLLLFREPIIDEKEQLALAPGSDAATPASSGLAAKNKLVRLVVLSFLDEISVDTAALGSNEHELLQQLLQRLLELNLTDDWTKQHMLNSDGFGKQLRSWQALCVLSKHVSSATIATVNDRFWRAFVFPHLPAMRYYMEIFAMRLVLRFPCTTITTHVVPLLANYNLIPQVGASLLLVAGYALYHRVDDAQLAGDVELCAVLVKAVLPWLNSSHSHTRILVQFTLAAVLPRYLHQFEQAAPPPASSTVAFSPSEVQFLKQTAAFLSQNKEAKRMNRRQRNQLTKFKPEFECSLLGVLSSATLNEFLDLFPSDDVLVFGAQFKDAMTELYAQFQREHLVADAPVRAVLGAAQDTAPREDENSAAAAATLNVQRKIDLSAILLDESVLPVAMHERGEMVAALNARNKRRQPVILCASLVDKIPNLAGLARTCEIFNAQTLIVPNLHACDDEVFSTISVTANKWMPIEQVRPEQGELVPALREWKRQGYTIVALEQTASSVCLSSYEFPEKIVIVLGKEKEGVPVDVLQMVDVCVEIPQFGLIRSLNVHVSGAILLWEYTQQHMARGQLTT